MRAGEEGGRDEQRLRARELDGYLILPPDFISQGKAEYFNRNPGDVISSGPLQSALSRATREQRLIEAKGDTKTRQALFKPVNPRVVRTGCGCPARE